MIRRFFLLLMGTKSVYTFTRPCAQRRYDSKTTQTKAGERCDLMAARTVAFTPFFGFDIPVHDLNGRQVEPVRRSSVKLLLISNGQT